MKSPAPTRLAAAAALGLLGCGDDLPELRYETEHLRIGTASDAQLCQGDLDDYEDVVTSLEQVLATNVRDPIDLYLWDDVTPFVESGWCTEEAAIGCYEHGAVYADALSFEHELVHAVIASFGEPTRFWNEGAAEALTHRTFFGDTAPVDNLDLEFPQLDYSTAGHFSRWLLETYGTDLYRELLRARGSSREAFESTYEMTVEEAQDLYFAQAPHEYGARLACRHPDLPEIDNLQWSEAIELDCDAPHVHGSSQAMFVFRVLTITERGYYELTTTAEAGTIAPCFDQDLEAPVLVGDPAYGDVPPASGGFPAQVFSGDDTAKPVLDLAPGRYELAVGIAGHEVLTVDLVVRAAAGPIPQTPESAG